MPRLFCHQAKSDLSRLSCSTYYSCFLSWACIYLSSMGIHFLFFSGGVRLALWMLHIFSSSGTIWWLFLAFGFSCFSAFLLLCFISFLFCFLLLCFSVLLFCFLFCFLFFFFSFCLFIYFFVSLLVFFSFWKTNPWRLLMAFIFNFVGCLSTWLSIVCPMWSKVGSDDGSIRRCNPGSRIFDCVLWTGWSRRDCSFPWMLDIVLPNGRQEMVRWGAVDRDVQSIEFMSCSNSGPTGHVSARASTERKRHDRRVGWEGDQSCCWRGWKKWGAAMATSSRWPGTAGWFSECSEKGKSDLKAGHRGLI